MRAGGNSLKQTRHVLRLMGRRMTSVYGSTILLETMMTRRCFLSSGSGSGDLHNRSSLLLITSKKKDGNGNDNNNNDPIDRKSVTTSTSNNAPPSTTPSSGGTTTTSDSNGDNLRDIPRRIIVKKNVSGGGEDSSAKGTDNNSSSKYMKQQQQRVGYLKRRFPLHNENTNNKTIWIPAKPIVIESGFGTDDQRSQQHLTTTTPTTPLIKQQLAQIRAAAWLDPGTYCKGGGGGTTIAGTEAARKLLRGKKDLIELLGYAVHSHSKQSIVLQCHGIPRQVLQHHVDYAARLLHRLQAQEVSFKQFNEVTKYNSVAAIDAVQSLRQVLLRNAVTGENQAIPWPLEDDDEDESADHSTTDGESSSLSSDQQQQPQQQQQQHHWVDDLTLYWTVMNRIATRLGVAVLLKRPGLGRERLEFMTNVVSSSSSSSTQQSSHSILKTPPYYWKVEFQRELHFSPEQLPPVGRSSASSASYANAQTSSKQPHQQPLQQQPLCPVLEFTPLHGVAAPGHCRIRLQGRGNPGNGLEALNVSLSFDACFRINHFVHAQ